MGIEKSELKSLIARNFAEEMRISGERAKKTVNAFDGAATAFLQAEKILNEQTQVARNALIDGKVDVDLTDPPALLKYIVDHFMRAARRIHELGDGARLSNIKAQGEVTAWEAAEKIHLQTMAEEQAKVEAFRAAAARGDNDVDVRDGNGGNGIGAPGPRPPRAPGEHPGPPMKAHREIASTFADEALDDAKAAPPEKAKAKAKPKPARKAVAKNSRSVERRLKLQSKSSSKATAKGGNNAENPG